MIGRQGMSKTRVKLTLSCLACTKNDSVEAQIVGATNVADPSNTSSPHTQSKRLPFGYFFRRARSMTASVRYSTVCCENDML